MQAIVTRYLPPTNFRGARIKATAATGSITLHWDHALNPSNNHLAAAEALSTKFGWNYGKWVTGCLADGQMVWICNAVGVDSFGGA
jgi:hypothetical protein